MNTLIPALAAVCLAVGCTERASAVQELGAASATGDEQRVLDERVPLWLEEHDVPSAAVTFIRDGNIAFTAVYGEQAPGVPATERTLYSTASLGKPITSEVVVRLASDGRLSLDEPMSPHWVDPDVENDPRHLALTPRVALTHQTGFANWRRMTDGVLKFQFDPGTRTGYSGEGMDYVVRFIERRLGASFDALAEAYVFAPAGMTSTAYTRRPWFEGRLAWPRFPDGEWREPRVLTEPSGAGDVRTTSADYARFVLSVMAGDGVTDALAAERVRLHSDLLASNCPPDRVDPSACPERAGFGLSWFVQGYDGETVVSHTGSNLGEKALVFFVPERGLGAVVFANGANGNRVIYRIADVLYDNDDWLTLVTPAED